MDYKKSKYIVLLVLFLSFFLIGTAEAQMISYPPGKIMGYRGLDTRSSAPNIPDGRAEDMMNVKLSAAFDLTKRPGFDTVNDLTLDDADLDDEPITGIFDAEFSNGTSQTLVFVGNKLKYDDGDNWTEVSGGVTITAGKNNQWQCLMALDNAACTNDTDLPIIVDNVPSSDILDTASLADAVTKVKTMVWYRNYLIMGNTVENSVERPTRFRWSDVGSISSWQDDNFVDISTFAGDEIIGFAELYGELYVFLTESIWKASLVGGDDVFIFRKIIDGLGTIARDSMQVVSLADNRTAIIFLDNRKKILLFNGIAVVDIGAIIQPTLDNLNESRLQFAVSTFDETDYFLCASDGGSSENDICFNYQTEINEWTKHTDINANAMAQVEESASLIKSYFGNYNSFVYWMDNPDLNNDVDGIDGIVDSVSTMSTDTITGGQILLDTVDSAAITGAIIKITSGTGAGQERVILSGLTTGILVSSAFTTTPDSTSVYTVGAIDAHYHSKHFELGDAAREKAQFLGMLLWANEESSNMVDVSYAIDFGSNIGSETVNLSPSGSSVWDTALWDTGVWGTSGSKIATVKFSGFGNHIQVKFDNDSINESFQLYGYNIVAVGGDIKQP